jgi:hypothetical protein
MVDLKLVVGMSAGVLTMHGIFEAAEFPVSRWVLKGWERA